MRKLMKLGAVAVAMGGAIALVPGSPAMAAPWPQEVTTPNGARVFESRLIGIMGYGSLSPARTGDKVWIEESPNGGQTKTVVASSTATSNVATLSAVGPNVGQPYLRVCASNGSPKVTTCTGW